MKYEREQIYTPPTVERDAVIMQQRFAISGYGQDSDDSEFGY